MKDLETALKGNVTIVNVGCVGDVDYPLPKNILKTLTVFEVDPGGEAVTSDRYHRKIGIRKPLAGTRGKRSFRRNNFDGTCSLLEPLDGAVESFGMEDYCRVVERLEFDCDTIPDVLRAEQITTLDFLKTDIEGLDHEVIRSCDEFLGKTHFVQCELRFRPFYQSEPYFHETVNMLVQRGYEVLDIVHLDRWKYKTPNRQFQVQGRAQWADFLFVLQPERLAETFGSEMPLAVAKQVVLSCMLGKKNYGEYLLEKFKSSVPQEWYDELSVLTRPAFPGMRNAFRSLRRTFYPLELLLKHQIGKSQFVAIR